MKEKKLIPRRRFEGYQESWMAYNWSETVDISTNMVDPRKDIYDDLFHVGPGNIESFSGTLLDNVKKVKEENLISGKFHFKSGDIIYGKINPQLGKYAIAEVEGLASADAYILNARNGVSQNFFFTILQSKDFYKYSVSVSSRTGMPKINRNELNQYQYFAPLFKEQQKIGEFFKQLDQMITLEQRKLEKTKSLKSAYLAEMFPAEGELVPKRRFSGFTDEWEEQKLEDLAESFGYGLNASAGDYDGVNKYIRITDIDDYTHLFNHDVLTSPQTDISTADNYLLREGDVLFARTGASVGKTYRYQKSDGKVYYAGFLIRARIKPEFNSEFIFQNTLTTNYEDFIRVTSQRSGQPGVNAQEYASFRLMLPSKKEQEAIGEFFNKLDESITNQRKKLKKLKAMKQAYLEEMFV